METRAQRQYASLDEALTDWKMPPENWGMIRRFTDAIGISAFFEDLDYIRAMRADGGPYLAIHLALTAGFASEAEARAATGSDAVWFWDQQQMWGVDHPVKKANAKAASSATPAAKKAGAKSSPAPLAVAKPPVPEYRVCEECFTTISAAGTCGCPDVTHN